MITAKSIVQPNVGSAPASPGEPDRSRFVDPFNVRPLVGYYYELFKWHGFLRFLGLPHLKEEPDTPIFKLFVQPSLSKSLISPDEDPKDWPEHENALAVIAENPRLVLLGDPGSGKSTLVSSLSYLLSRSGESRWKNLFGPLVPIPMVLRDLKLPAELGWDGLLKAFLAHPMAAKLEDWKGLDELQESGQAFFLLDGIDELSSRRLRKALREAVHEGMRRFPRCRWLLTSRWVGYDEVPFHLNPRRREGKELPVEKKADPADEIAEVRYLAPFDDDRLQRFARAWHAARETAEHARQEGSRGFFEAVSSNPYTLRLARIPGLATLMALIYRIEAELPDGRAVLYEKIERAYLETIDRFRKLPGIALSRRQKRRILAKVGFQMQLQRGAAKEESGEREREILVDRKTLEGWIAAAMASMAEENPEIEAAEFLDHIGRRSGLLLPRGEGRYAFTHLSFQEYFAAVYLAQAIRKPGWPKPKKTAEGASVDDLRRYAASTAWRESLLLLFEILAEDEDWSEELAEVLFDEKFSRLEEDDPREEAALAVLVAEIAADPHSGLSVETRGEALSAAWSSEVKGQNSVSDDDFFLKWDPSVVRALTRVSGRQGDASWKALSKCWNREGKKNRLMLSHTRVEDLSPLANLQSLQGLFLQGTRVEDLSPLKNLQSLQGLDLQGTRVEDLSPLAKLQSLQWLDLQGTRVEKVTIEELRATLPKTVIFP